MREKREIEGNDFIFNKINKMYASENVELRNIFYI